MFVVSWKGPKGSQKLSFDEAPSIFILVEKISEELDIPIGSVWIKLGFPPRPLSVSNEKVLCTDVGIGNRESFTVTEDKELSILTQCGISEEIKEPVHEVCYISYFHYINITNIRCVWFPKFGVFG